MELFDHVNQTHNKDSFLAFLAALGEDYHRNKDDWANRTIDSFLDAVYRWVDEYEGNDIDFSVPGWKEIAAIFYMGKIYE